jgi:hypothetical protein
MHHTNIEIWRETVCLRKQALGHKIGTFIWHVFQSTAHAHHIAEIPGMWAACWKEKPTSAMDSNKHKTGLEQSHQMPSHYSFQSKSAKWWKKLFFYS